MHLFRQMIGKIKVILHVDVPDEQLYAFISLLKPNANRTDRDPYVQNSLTLRNLCRSRGLTLGSGKRAMIKKLMEYLEDKGLLPVDPQWPQPFVAPTAAPLQAEVAIAAIAAADGTGDDNDE